MHTKLIVALDKDRASNNFRFWRKAEYQLAPFGSEKSTGVPRSIEHFFRSERGKMVFRFDARNRSYYWPDPKYKVVADLFASCLHP